MHYNPDDQSNVDLYPPSLNRGPLFLSRVSLRLGTFLDMVRNDRVGSGIMYGKIHQRSRVREESLRGKLGILEILSHAISG